jgi:molybdopterin molybdotransferase
MNSRLRRQTMAEAAAELLPASAVARLSALLPLIEQFELMPLAQAAGRVLATDVTSAIDLPAFDNSAMDGYALRHADIGTGTLQEIGTSYAGHGFDGTVAPGTCVRIMTGAPVPAGADTVVVMEDVDRSDGHVRVNLAPAPGLNIRRRGEHIAAGAVALMRGTPLDDAAIGLAASVGLSQLPVLRRLRVALLSTGDELADAPAPLFPAGSYDANRPLLRSACMRLGFETHDLGICADRADDFSRAIETALALRCDVLLISGGAAQGDADIVRQAGGVQFLPLAIRPGRGLAHARLSRGGQLMALLGLPGNAVAAFVVFHLVARPLLLHLAGATPRLLPRLFAALAQPVQLRGGRIDYRRGHIDHEGRVHLLKDQGSAMLRSVTQADCLVALGPQDSYATGAQVEVIPLGLLI